jgi:hypothetical protein
LPARRKGKAPGATLRGLSRHLGVSLAAVQKGITSGRLRKSVSRDGTILDVALARREWDAGASKPANGGGRSRGAPTRPGPKVTKPENTLVSAQYRVSMARAVALEQSNLQKRGELLDRETVKREQFEVARILRERILNVPDRLAELDPAVRARIRAELRQALGDIADELENG